ncbi:YfhO family protein [Streptomyces sp. NBC_00083]|uniref:YfhO family protein n=1 Tax=Streptomyces sp. NBC_00083 TaxID=2975647 RepID=UPI002254E3D1|nr:YfhO family protein [Streptomyces sp. NBC_00083]MCX5382465.1 YfhO family protein [Streptomyces sp. NBC_00083]
MLKTSPAEQAATTERSSRPRPKILGAQTIAATLSAVISMGAYCLAMAVHGTYPFGSRSRAVNDLGNQFVPFHAHLWDLLRGDASGDLFFNWNSGFGVPFLGDFFTYLMNPFSWLVPLFPRDQVEIPVFLVTVVSAGLAAFLMTVLLGRLHPGSPWLRGLLSVGYAVSAWMISDGFSDPMWMWGMAAFPLLGIASDWCLRGRHWILGTLLVFAAWAGNFYIAAMATIGMGLVFVVRLLLEDTPARQRLNALLRAGAMTATGILLAAPVLTVGLKASKLSQPAPDATYQGPPGYADYLAHLLPGGLLAPAPQVSVGILPLLLVFTLPFVRRVPGKERIAWCVLLVLVALSYVWTPTILLWHGLAMPNGSPYRASIALTAMLVIVAWMALARRPHPKELLYGAVVTAVVVALGARSIYMVRAAWILTIGGGVLVLALLVLLYRHRGDRGPRIALTGLLACTVFLSTAYTVFSVTSIRDAKSWWAPKRTLDAHSLAARAAVRAHDDWPATRSDPGPHEYANNDPMLLGGEGGSYYSSYVPAKTAEALQSLGAGWYIQGRHTLSFTDPVGRAIMGVSSYLDWAKNPDGFVQHSVAAPPVVTLRPGRTTDTGAHDASVYARQERVLGATVYDVPALAPAGGPPATPGPSGELHLPGTTTGSKWTSFTASCTPGAEAYWYAPWYAGSVQALGRTQEQHGRATMTSNTLLPLGTVPATGKFTVALGTHKAQDIPRFPVGCLNPAKLKAAVQELKATAPLKVTAGGHSIAATFRKGTTGTAVISTPAVTGWQCSVDGGAARAPGTLGGLMAVDLGDGGSRVSCSFQTPGLKPGLLASGLALLVLLAVGVGAVLRVRSSRTSPLSSSHGKR